MYGEREKGENPQYSNSFSIEISYPTAFTPYLIHHALAGLDAIYQNDYHYKKAGVYLSKITPLDAVQPDLFGAFSLDSHQRHARLMCIVDAINRIYGRDTLSFAVQGITRPWAMRRLHVSPHFTTLWDEIIAVSVGG